MAKIGIPSNAAKGWIPQGTVHLFHGLLDFIVPYTQLEDAIEEFKSSSVPSGRVVKTIYPLGDHYNKADKYITETYKLFKK
ncbi:MAG: hypothetical protein ACRCZY_01830 [Phocaeicola sp.]